MSSATSTVKTKNTLVVQLQFQTVAWEVFGFVSNHIILGGTSLIGYVIAGTYNLLIDRDLSATLEEPILINRIQIIV